MKAFSKKNISIVFGIIVAMMMIGSFCDYAISSAIFNKESIFGIFFASYGQLPGMLCFSLGGTLLIQVCLQSKIVFKVLGILLGVFLNAFAVLGITMDPMLYIEGMNAVVSAVIAVVLVAVTDYLLVKYSQEASRESKKKLASLFLLTMLLEMVLINIVKIPWARPRMRMLAEQSSATFQPWWVIGCEFKDALLAAGVKAEEFKSFPSGHTGNAACAILLCALPMVCAKLKGKENQLFFAGLAFALIVAFSRIIMGAHFLTDVTVGFTVTFVVILFLNKVLKLNKVQ